LNVVLLITAWGGNRELFPLLERFGNLYFDVSANQANDILEIAKKHFGIERALYGTDWPYRPMGTIKGLVEYAELSEKDKDAVAAGNALRLLGLDAERFAVYDDADCRLDEIAVEADAGKPLSVPVFDAHTHMLPAEDKAFSGFIMPNGDCDSIAKKMKRLGIDSVITAPFQGISTDGVAGNEQTLYAAQRYPGRFYGFSTCNIHYAEDLAGWKAYHERYPDIFVGIKPYWPYQQFDLCAPVCSEWFGYANEHRLLFLLHTDSQEAVIAQAEKLFVKYPGIQFLLAHSGTDWDVARRNTALAKKYPNVYLEITFTSCTRGTVEYMVSEAGADKVLYGSDLPMRDPSPQLAWVAYAKISVEDKKKIFAANIRRLIASAVRPSRP
jgi:predicted TIM-barrel fold metal-dependent hydrolase